MALFCNSNAALEVAYNHKLNNQSKHINVAYHSARDQIEQGNVSVMYVPMEEYVPDIWAQGITRYVNDH